MTNPQHCIMFFICVLRNNQCTLETVWWTPSSHKFKDCSNSTKSHHDLISMNQSMKMLTEFLKCRREMFQTCHINPIQRFLSICTLPYVCKFNEISTRTDCTILKAFEAKVCVTSGFMLLYVAKSESTPKVFGCESRENSTYIVVFLERKTPGSAYQVMRKRVEHRNKLDAGNSH